MAEKYSDCWHCGGAVKESSVEYDYHWKGKLYIFENAPMGVCKQCGEKFVKSYVAKKMEQIVLKNTKPLKEVTVPVYSF
ncbi:MAG: YgiT-type zinc finger protein [Planctomycetota bacterium]|nr:YgiT-type zinc finger protein [Planctomycetota bacterium]